MRYCEKIFDAFWDVLPLTKSDRFGLKKSVVINKETDKDFSFGIRNPYMGNGVGIDDGFDNEDPFCYKHPHLRKGERIVIYKMVFQYVEFRDGLRYNIEMEYFLFNNKGERVFEGDVQMLKEEVSIEDLYRVAKMAQESLAARKRPIYVDVDAIPKNDD